jgi:hypothetical protein
MRDQNIEATGLMRYHPWVEGKGKGKGKRLKVKERVYEKKIYNRSNGWRHGFA